uniref:SFRICE_033856 n=1 Tax=Spodoptera frugiperda TaxID=7108 RepID=A0A2H1WF37_SPOFR
MQYVVVLTDLSLHCSRIGGKRTDGLPDCKRSAPPINTCNTRGGTVYSYTISIHYILGTYNTREKIRGGGKLQNNVPILLIHHRTV